MQKKDFPFLAVVFVLYCLLEITGSWFHVLWADEIHAWNIALNSHSFAQLIENQAYQGHPVMWYIILFGLKSVLPDPAIMKVFHSLVAIVSVFLFLRHSPFSRLQKALFVFGYYILFEYAILNRNYAIEVLLLIILMIFYRDRIRRLLWFSVILFLILQTNVFGMIIAMSLAVSMVFEFIISPGFRAQVLARKGRLAAAVIIFSAGLAYAVISILPVEDCYITVPLPFGAITLKNFINSVASFWRGMIPVPAYGIHFWDTHFIGSVVVQFILAILMIFSVTVMFAKRPVILVLSSTGILGMLFFVFDFYTGSLRHHGHYYLLFIICLWLWDEYPDREKPLSYRWIEKYNRFLNRNRKTIVTALLAVHMVSGIYCTVSQIITPFSQARNTADYIRENNLDRFTIAGDWDWYAASVEGYFNKEFYYYTRNAYTRFVILDNKRVEYPQKEIIRRTDSLSRALNDTLLVLLNYPLGNAVASGFRPVATFRGSVLALEQYYLYLYRAGEDSTVTAQSR
jgi:hypothetical protein